MLVTPRSSIIIIITTTTILFLHHFTRLPFWNRLESYLHSKRADPSLPNSPKVDSAFHMEHGDPFKILLSYKPICLLSGSCRDKEAERGSPLLGSPDLRLSLREAFQTRHCKNVLLAPQLLGGGGRELFGEAVSMATQIPIRKCAQVTCFCESFSLVFFLCLSNRCQGTRCCLTHQPGDVRTSQIWERCLRKADLLRSQKSTNVYFGMWIGMQSRDPNGLCRRGGIKAWHFWGLRCKPGWNDKCKGAYKWQAWPLVAVHVKTASRFNKQRKDRERR